MLDARSVTVRAGDRTILQPTSLRLEPGRLVALIGPSGAGKSTLLRVLAGELTPDGGQVQLGDVPLARRTDEVGFVPFTDLLHDRLTVREALTYVAKLRGLTAAEVVDRVDDVLAELKLLGRQDAFVATLSGGERRRAAVAMELLGRPSVLLLDEPATGLDARLERRLMELLREVADQDRAVVVATHATASLALCDEVLVMGPDGRARFLGPPEELLEHFDVPAFERVYEALDHDARGLDDTAAADGPPPEPAPLRPEYLAPLGTQARVLADRYRRTLLRDRRTLAVLVGQAPAIGIAIGLALPARVLESSTTQGYYGAMLAFLLTIASLWLGVITSCREVVKEERIVLREAAVGVRLDAYLAAKCLVLFPLAAVQAVLMLACVAVVQPLQASGAELGQLAVLCVLTSWAAVALGLWVSSWARSTDQATSTVPLVLIPQLLLAGAVIPIAQMVAVTKAVSVLALSRWSFAGVGGVLDVDGRLRTAAAGGTGFEPSFFARPAGQGALTLLVFVLVALVAAGVQLDRRVSRARRDGLH